MLAALDAADYAEKGRKNICFVESKIVFDVNVERLEMLCELYIIRRLEWIHLLDIIFHRTVSAAHATIVLLVYIMLMTKFKQELSNSERLPIFKTCISAITWSACNLIRSLHTLFCTANANLLSRLFSRRRRVFVRIFLLAYQRLSRRVWINLVFSTFRDSTLLRSFNRSLTETTRIPLSTREKQLARLKSVICLKIFSRYLKLHINQVNIFMKSWNSLRCVFESLLHLCGCRGTKSQEFFSVWSDFGLFWAWNTFLRRKFPVSSVCELENIQIDPNIR